MTETVAPGVLSESAVTDLNWAAAVAAIRPHAPSGRVLLLCHVNPDGDALGSMLAFALGLRRLGTPAPQAVFPGPFEIPEPFAGLPGLDLLVPEERAYPDPDPYKIGDDAEGRVGAYEDRS